MAKDERTRNWNCIIYPDSAPENWRDIINETHIEWIESPLHDKDVDPDGVLKKPHYHVTLMYPSNKSFEQVSDLVCKQLNAPIPVKCQSVKGSIRYMCHKDNPEKYQYNWSDIKCHGGADLRSLCLPTSTEKLEIQKQIIEYCRVNNITEFSDIVNYANDTGNTEWLYVLLNYSTLSINAYIKSLRHKSCSGKTFAESLAAKLDFKAEEDKESLIHKSNSNEED